MNLWISISTFAAILALGNCVDKNVKLEDEDHKGDQADNTDLEVEEDTTVAGGAVTSAANKNLQVLAKNGGLGGKPKGEASESSALKNPATATEDKGNASKAGNTPVAVKVDVGESKNQSAAAPKPGKVNLNATVAQIEGTAEKPKGNANDTAGKILKNASDIGKVFKKAIEKQMPSSDDNGAKDLGNTTKEIEKETSDKDDKEDKEEDKKEEEEEKKEDAEEKAERQRLNKTANGSDTLPVAALHGSAATPLKPGETPVAPNGSPPSPGGPAATLHGSAATQSKPGETPAAPNGSPPNAGAPAAAAGLATASEVVGAGDVPTFTEIVPTKPPPTTPPPTEAPTTGSIIGVIPLLPNPLFVDNHQRQMLTYGKGSAGGGNEPENPKPESPTSPNTDSLPGSSGNGDNKPTGPASNPIVPVGNSSEIEVKAKGQKEADKDDDLKEEIDEMEHISTIAPDDSPSIDADGPNLATDPPTVPKGNLAGMKTQPDLKPVVSQPSQITPADGNEESPVSHHIAAGIASKVLRNNAKPPAISQAELSVQQAVEKIFEEVHKEQVRGKFVTQDGIKALIGDLLSESQIKKLVGKTFTEVMRLVRGAAGGVPAGGDKIQEPTAPVAPAPPKIPDNVTLDKEDEEISEKTDKIEVETGDRDDVTRPPETPEESAPPPNPKGDSPRGENGPTPKPGIGSDSPFVHGRVMNEIEYTNNTSRLFVPLIHFLHNMKDWFEKATKGKVHSSMMQSGLNGEEVGFAAENNRSHEAIMQVGKEISKDNQVIKHDYEAVYRWQYETYGICLAILVLLIILLVMVLLGMMCNCGKYPETDYNNAASRSSLLLANAQGPPLPGQIDYSTRGPAYPGGAKAAPQSPFPPRVQPVQASAMGRAMDKTIQMSSARSESERSAAMSAPMDPPPPSQVRRSAREDDSAMREKL